MTPPPFRTGPQEAATFFQRRNFIKTKMPANEKSPLHMSISPTESTPLSLPDTKAYRSLSDVEDATAGRERSDSYVSISNHKGM